MGIYSDSASSLRPLEAAAAAAEPPPEEEEAAAAAAEPPKEEDAAAAVADPTSPPKRPPEVAAAAAEAPPLLKPRFLACRGAQTVKHLCFLGMQGCSFVGQLRWPSHWLKHNPSWHAGHGCL